MNYRDNAIVHAFAIAGTQATRVCDGGGIPSAPRWEGVTCPECLARRNDQVSPGREGYE